MASVFDTKERLVELYGPVEMALEAIVFGESGVLPRPYRFRCRLRKMLFLFKELHDWERTDNPWDEHVRHTIKKGKPCPFIELGKVEAELTVGEFFELTNKRLNILFEKLKEEVLKTFDNY
ncbi:Baculoviral IAP repeat-containing protein 5.2 [Trichinella zimbabwensis]|uniref:Baculoviral IAP repeat-containing protein 5.2 n=1 Tax=Trichinella zimbabwensis TaxID=268475 RepID=A0A0V1GUM7_9BILA|nr:Baculoviral IAP repeat-containing protein 5.2 [Trichinella zimbabwensis]KRZ02055.1 Baculoviral IAP repeat-containing protein 5.2 [Trichinella zimbabwensis]